MKFVGIFGQIELLLGLFDGKIIYLAVLGFFEVLLAKICPSALLSATVFEKAWVLLSHFKVKNYRSSFCNLEMEFLFQNKDKQAPNYDSFSETSFFDTLSQPDTKH
jgi:hypothetical protein